MTGTPKWVKEMAEAQKDIPIIDKRALEMKRRRVLKDLEEKGLVAHAWIIDKKTGESVLHLAVTDKAREILNGLGRRDDGEPKHPSE